MSFFKNNSEFWKENSDVQLGAASQAFSAPLSIQPSPLLIAMTPDSASFSPEVEALRQRPKFHVMLGTPKLSLCLLKRCTQNQKNTSSHRGIPGAQP